MTTWRHAHRDGDDHGVAVERLVGEQRVEGQSFDERRDADRVSNRCPGSSAKRTRLPSASVNARILVVMPPFAAPDGLAFESPSSHSVRGDMDFDDCGVDHGVFDVGILGHGLEQPTRPHRP